MLLYVLRLSQVFFLCSFCMNAESGMADYYAEECKQRNYNTTKDKKAHPERVEMKKYCRFCRKHTVHKETK